MEELNEEHLGEQGQHLQHQSEETLQLNESLLGLPLLEAINEPHLSYAWYQLDEASLPLLSSLQPSVRRKYLKMGILPGPRRYELGRFAIDEHHHVLFEAVPQLDYVGYSEVTEVPANTPPKKEFKDDMSVTQRFLQLTKKDDPVPSMLLELDEDIDDRTSLEELKRRDVVDTLDPIVIERPELPITSPPETTETHLPVCFSGGLSNFASQYCENKGIDFCDNGAHYSQLTRSSGDKRRRYSHTRISSCFATTIVSHFYRGWWFGWKWFYVTYPIIGGIQQFIQSHQHKYWRHKGGVKRRRKVEIYKATGDGYFRAWSAFYNS